MTEVKKRNPLSNYITATDKEKYLLSIILLYVN